MRGGWNLYQYPLNPVTNTDALGLEAVLPGPFFLPFPWLKSPVQQEADANANAAKTLTKWWNETSFDVMTQDMVVMMAALYVTCSSNVDSAEDSANPNVGKDLTDEEKNELGGTGSGTPGGWGPEDEQDARGREQHELYKDELRQQMEKPTVENAELKNLIDDLYRPNPKVDSGSTAHAVRYELSTGEKVGDRGHIQKAEQYSELLQRWLNKNPSASLGDRVAAENVLKDLQRALRGE